MIPYTVFKVSYTNSFMGYLKNTRYLINLMKYIIKHIRCLMFYNMPYKIYELSYQFSFVRYIIRLIRYIMKVMISYKVYDISYIKTACGRLWVRIPAATELSR